jgi:hypothetical protein
VFSWERIEDSTKPQQDDPEQDLTWLKLVRTLAADLTAVMMARAWSLRGVC